MLVLGPSRCWRRCSPGTHTHTLRLTCRPAQVGGACSSGRGLTSTREELHSRALTATRAERSTSARGHTKRTHLAPSTQSWTHNTHTRRHTGHETGRRPLWPLCSITLGVHCYYQGVRFPLVSVQGKDGCFSLPNQLLALLQAPPPPLLLLLLWAQLIGRCFCLSLRRCDWPTAALWDVDVVGQVYREVEGVDDVAGRIAAGLRGPAHFHPGEVEQPLPIG